MLAHDVDGEINVLYAAQDVGYEVAGLEGFVLRRCVTSSSVAPSM
jgi:hypothetical protein